MQALLRAESSPLQVLVLCFSYLDSYVSFYVTNGFTLRFLYMCVPSYIICGVCPDLFLVCPRAVSHAC